jgi:hypothetical protein
MAEGDLSREQLRVLFDAKIPMCGCGCPEAGVKLIHDVLKLHPLYEHREEFETLLPNTGVRMIVLGLIDEARLNEHGGGIGGSWLTPLGKRVLAALDRELAEHTDDEEPFESFTQSHCVHGFYGDKDHDCLGAGEPVVPSEEGGT